MLFRSYNATRPHQALHSDSPHSREVQPSVSGRIVATPQVGRLHHASPDPSRFTRRLRRRPRGCRRYCSHSRCSSVLFQQSSPEAAEAGQRGSRIGTPVVRQFLRLADAVFDQDTSLEQAVRRLGPGMRPAHRTTLSSVIGRSAEMERAGKNIPGPSSSGGSGSRWLEP